MFVVLCVLVSWVGVRRGEGGWRVGEERGKEKKELERDERR